MVFGEGPTEYRPTHIVRDRDSKFDDNFCSILEDDGIVFKKIAPMSPNMNPFAEAWVQRTKHEVLNNFIVFGEDHLRFLLKEWLTYYHEFRPHQGLGNVPISGIPGGVECQVDFQPDDIVCHHRLGGLLKHYERKAA